MASQLARGALFIALSAVPLAAHAVAAPPAEAAEDESALRTYYSANGLLNRGLYDLAADEYRAFLAAHPDDEKAPIARYGLGVSLFRLEKWAEALAELDQLRGAPTEFAAEIGTIRGQCLLALERPSDAATALEAVATSARGHDLADDATALLAEAQYHAGRYDAVEAAYQSLIEQWPESSLRERAALYRGLAQMAEGEWSEAAQGFDEMAARYPEGEYAPRTALLLAQALHRSGSLERATSEYREVIRQARDAYLPDAMHGLALLLYRQEQLAAAAPVLEAFLERYEAHALANDVRLLRGRVAYDGADWPTARSNFERLAAEGPSFADASAYWLAKCDLREGKPDAAAERLEAAALAFPLSRLAPEIAYDLAVARSRAGATEPALTSADAFLRRFPEHALAPDAEHLAASSLSELARYDESVARCRTFAERYPDHELAPAMAFLAIEGLALAERDEETVEACALFLERRANAEQAEAVRFRLGMSLYRLGRDGAEEPLRAVVGDASAAPEAFRPALLALGDLAFRAGRFAEAEERLEAYLAGDAQPASADDALLELGLARHRQDDLTGALEAYDLLLANHAQSPQALQARFERAQALSTLDRDEEAEEGFLAVLQAARTSRFAPYAHDHLGAISSARGEHAEAAERFGDAAEAFDDPLLASGARFRQAQSLIAAGDFRAARPVLAALLVSDAAGDRAPAARANLVIAESRLGNHAAAIEAAGVLTPAQIDSLDADLRAALWYERAWCLRELDRSADAEGAYRALLEKPGGGVLRHHARLEIAELEQNAERLDEAARELRTLLAELEGSPHRSDALEDQALHRLGACEFRRGDWSACATALETHLEKYPKSERAPSSALLCGEALFRAGRFEQATAFLALAAASGGSADTAGKALLRLGESRAALSDWKASEEAFNRWLEKFAGDELWFQAEFGSGFARENLGRHDEAIASYQRVVDRHSGPTAARAQFQIGECLYAQKKFEDAVRAFLRVDILYAYPEWSAAALYEAGRTFQELSNPVEARRHFERVERDHPSTSWAPLAAQRLAEMSRSTLPGHASADR